MQSGILPVICGCTSYQHVKCKLEQNKLGNHGCGRCKSFHEVWMVLGFHEARDQVKSICISYQVDFMFLGHGFPFYTVDVVWPHLPTSPWNIQVIIHIPIFHWQCIICGMIDWLYLPVRLIFNVSMFSQYGTIMECSEIWKFPFSACPDISCVCVCVCACMLHMWMCALVMLYVLSIVGIMWYDA